MTQISRDKLSILKFGIILMSFFGLFIISPKVDAAISSAPTNIQPEDPDIYYTVSSGSNTGQGSNLLYSPEVWIRIYKSNNDGGSVIFKHGNHCNSGSGWDSDNYQPTVFELHGTNPDGTENLKVRSTAINSLQTNAAGTGCGDVTLNIPPGTMTLSDDLSHKSTSGVQLYAGIIKVYIRPGTPTNNGPLNVFKVKANGFMVGSIATAGWGQRSTQTLLGRPGSTDTKTYVLPFKPPCDAFIGKSSIQKYLEWFDDDHGTSYQGNFTVKLVEYDETGTVGTVVKVIGERSGEGKGAKSLVTLKKNKRYEWVWEGMTNKNGVQVYYPFESADFYFDCNRDVKYGIKQDANLECTKIYGWAFDEDVPTKAVAMTVTVDKPAGPTSTYLMKGKGANLPYKYVNDQWPSSKGTPHGFDIDISDYTYPSYNGTSRTFFIYFTDYNKSGSDTGDRITAKVEINNNDCKTKYTQGTFKLTPTGKVQLDDTEDPKVASFTGIGVKKVSPTAIKKVTVTRRFYIKRLNNPTPVEITPAPQAHLVTIPNNRDYPFDPPNTDVDLSSYSLRPGDQVCVTVTANPGKGDKNSSGDWIANSKLSPVTSPEDCKTVVNKPFVSFYGGDVSAGGAFIGTPGNCSSPSNIATYTKADKKGSGVQYAAFSLGDIITNPGSSGGFNSARLRAREPKPPKGLTFASKTAGLGNFGGDHCVPDYFGDGTQNAGGFNNVFDFNKNSGDYFVKPTAGQQYNLSGKIPNGKRYNLYVQGDLRITGKGIEYASTSWNTLADIPSLHVFVKGHIYIDPSVEVVTGMFVAQPIGVTKGTVFTCAKGVVRHDPDERFNSCNKPLKVNGSIIALKILLDRTSSSLRFANNEDTPSGSVGAEVFDLTPEHYIVAPGSRSTSNTNPPKFDYYTALPPIL